MTCPIRTQPVREQLFGLHEGGWNVRETLFTGGGRPQAAREADVSLGQGMKAPEIVRELGLNE